MSSLQSLTSARFLEVLQDADMRRTRRLAGIAPLLESGSVCLFGFGGKGRTLARHIRSHSGTSVIVYDSNPATRKHAAEEGFATVETVGEVRDGKHAVVLGACQAQLEQASVVNGRHVYYQEAAHLFDAPHLANSARDFPAWILANADALYDLYVSVHPDSRQNLVDVLTFRLSLDPHDLAASRRPNPDMWFDVLEACSTRQYRTLLDVGAYDGDTLRLARQRLPLTRGIAVEANRDLFESIGRVALAYEDGILVVPRAAWSHRCRLRFSEVRGGMITASEDPEGELEAASLDEQVDEPVDLIKMDIEGAELAALAGCTRILKTGPDLAIAAYHRPDDLIQFPALLAEAGYRPPDFDLHVAHYSDCIDDTIYYFVRTR